MKCSNIWSISKCEKEHIPNMRNSRNYDILVVSMVRPVAVWVIRWDVFWVQQSKIDLTYYIIKQGIGMADRCLDRIFVGWEMVSDETKYACVMLPYDTGLNTIRFEMRNNCVVRGIGYFGPISDISKNWRNYGIEGLSQWHWKCQWWIGMGVIEIHVTLDFPKLRISRNLCNFIPNLKWDSS